ncbi:DNA polymerase III, alpha subunit [Pseudarthrobacter chlorophenolicus A6]|uniref:DNA-directed DNA polymerase n=1 Tax=Pseudarthrobacter chlorophenolicus (strain ATCC 700700 / DSM 12829 / CIP 107037 / JCM 12360 / KCTC 9906 / NCIMB 13794 / A6) TaxID=452863 RepID=B8H9E9_PSECP|nr:DNA polymerase III subunit alpha [Pseudarthrobacter chlorophenolicus]ACL40018.1 DNA polymerase III, alpha subunit [Pseudarthrobacter chlorophenolicus A6]SDQ89490.1 DNA polymerase III, alpha subunit [Pseudarthrobacter chlorophenolicus]
MSFTHLHVSTAFSAHYGVSWPEELAQAAAADGASALACTDRDGLYGTIKHLKACMAAGLDPIVGVDLAVLDDDGDRRTEVAGRVVVLAKGHNNGAGYRALCRLISDAHARTSGKAGGTVPVAVTRAELASRTLDPQTLKPVLLVLIGPDSDVGRAMGGRRYLRPRTLFKQWLDAMPAGTVVAEIVSQLSTPGSPLSTAHAVRMLRLAEEHRVPAVLTNAVRYCGADGAPTADVLDSARTLKSLPELAGEPLLQPTGQGWLKTSNQMRRLAQEVISAAGYGAADLTQLLAQTEALADACRIDPAGDMGWKQPVVPEASIIGINQDPALELVQRCHAGIGRRFPGITGTAEQAMLTRLEHELTIIRNLNFSSYFLTVAEVSRMIQDMGVRAAARGSGASSLVNYLIDVSQVNPLQHDLIFERFLSQDRATLPDIDIDVESAERHNVYRKIFERFGAERVTLMSMQNGYRARGAVRDAGLALGMDGDEVGEIAKQLWRFSAGKFREALQEKPELREFAGRVEQRDTDGNQQLDLLVDLTERLDRLPRHISMHPCGVILGDATLLDRTPVQPSGLGLPMSQFDKHDMDPMGMLKLDVLGVRMQSAMAFAVREVIRLHPSKEEVVAAGNHPRGPQGSGPDYIADNGHIDLNAVPLDDQATFELIRSTHTLGCFQIESPGQRELIGKMAPREFNDLIIDISLFRPGPMKSDMVRPFLEHRHGFAPEVYPHPDLKPVLAETHGVTVFHEQILKTFDVMTHCGLARADEFRRALGNEIREPDVEEFFRKAARARGYAPEVLDKVWGTLKAFGSFGFCKAHGAAFAVPTYQSAWLKTHHPEAFLAGLWEHDPGMYPKRLLVAEARRLGIPILPLDINRSKDEYRVERILSGADSGKLGIRLSLKGIYGLSATELKRIVAGQPFDSLADLRSRSRISKPSIKRLAQLGAFDSLHREAGGTANRADLVQHLQQLQVTGSRKGTDVLEGQLSFPLGDIELRNVKPGLPQPTLVETVRAELDLMAVDVSTHLMDSHRPVLERLGVTTADKLLGLRNGTEVLVAGVRVATQTPPMRGGRRVVFISIDDGTGCIDSVFFHEAQESAGPLLFGTRMLLIRGTTRRTGPRGISLSASMAWDLSRTETLPFPPSETPFRDVAHPLDGIARSLAITGFNG